MTLSDVKTIIERAKASIESSSDDAYKDVLGNEIDGLMYAICLDQEVADISWIDDSWELPNYLAKQAEELEQSI